MVWTQLIAQNFHDTLTPARQGGFGVEPVEKYGYGYAEGGATVATTITDNILGATARPISRQIDAYLADHHSFDENQIILIQGGGNDIIAAVRNLSQGDTDSDEPSISVATAAKNLAALVARMIDFGGKNIVLVSVSDIGLIPFGVLNPSLRPELTRMSKFFNETLRESLLQKKVLSKILFIDAEDWYASVIRNYRKNGFLVSNNDVACSQDKIYQKAVSIGLPDPTSFFMENGTAILCSTSTLKQANAEQTFMFADEFHPSGKLHRMFATFVLQRLSEAGIRPAPH